MSSRFYKLGILVNLIMAMQLILSGQESELTKGADRDSITNSIGMVLVGVPDIGEEVLRDVDGVATSLYVGMTEVTQSQWLRIMRTNPSASVNPDQPVEKLTIDEAEAFCDRLSEREGRVYRLPSMKEWSAICTAGVLNDRGEKLDLDEFSVYLNNYSREGPAAVAQKKANSLGLYDLQGNVSEFCAGWDPYDPVLSDESKVLLSSGFIVIKGGSFVDTPELCECDRQRVYPRSVRASFIGFRVCLEFPKNAN